MLFSLFIVLNACIGYSSAPFYDPHADCKLKESSSECQSLKTLVTWLYAAEIFVSLILVGDGLFALALSDNQEQKWLRRVVSIYSKVALFIIPILLVIRTMVYVAVEKRLQPLDTVSWFGGLFAVYMPSKTAELVLSAIVTLLYVLSYLAIAKLVCLVSQLTVYLWSVEQKELSQAFEIE